MVHKTQQCVLIKWQIVHVDLLELIPNFVVPNWRIIKRRNVSNEIISGIDIINNTNDRLEWIADPLNGNNSVLRVGPVDGTDDQSSYQCSFALLNEII